MDEPIEYLQVARGLLNRSRNEFPSIDELDMLWAQQAIAAVLIDIAETLRAFREDFNEAQDRADLRVSLK